MFFKQNVQIIRFNIFSLIHCFYILNDWLIIFLAFSEQYFRYIALGSGEGYPGSNPQNCSARPWVEDRGSPNWPKGSQVIIRKT
jgi:hypothetical protein